LFALRQTVLPLLPACNIVVAPLLIKCHALVASQDYLYSDPPSIERYLAFDTVFVPLLLLTVAEGFNLYCQKADPSLLSSQRSSTSLQGCLVPQHRPSPLTLPEPTCPLKRHVSRFFR
jgi:hypothetical protein